MSTRRILGVALLLSVAAACAPQTRSNAVRPIKPQDGPNGFIHATYNGGLVFRDVSAQFQVDESAYVLVGHLSGDGVIRIVYPQRPRDYYARVRAKTTMRTQTFYAQHDGAPYLFSFTPVPFRTTGSMMDSYDGRGHGFIFMIATRSPVNLTELTDGGEWDVVDVIDYARSTDPRLAVRDFTESLAGDTPYTLKFANSFGTQSIYSVASASFDCALLSSYGLGYGFWGSWGAPGFRHLGGRGSYGGESGCGASRQYGYYAFHDFGRRYDVGPRGPWPAPVPPVTGPRPLTPRLPRPGERPLGDHSPAVLVTRSALDRGPSRGGRPREPEVDRGRSVSFDDFESRPTRRTVERSTPKASDDSRPSRPREITPAQERARATETSRPTVERSRPAEQPKPSEPARASPPRETRAEPKPDKPQGG